MSENVNKQHSPEDLKRIKALRLIDDDFLTIVFDGYKEGVELLLKVILGRDDLKVCESGTQKQINTLQGRSVRLDIFATDNTGDKYNIEIQRDNRGAIPQRARYHSSIVDSEMLRDGDDFSDLPHNYVIFITEKDVLGYNRPIYHINRVIYEENVQFNDGEHIIYVNGSIRTNDTELGRLINDFYCTDVKDMYYRELSDRVRYFKETEKGVDTMCEIWEEVRNEGINEGFNKGINEGFNKGINEARLENALKMINDGTLSLDKIAEYSGLPVEKVRELAGNKTA